MSLGGAGMTFTVGKQPDSLSSCPLLHAAEFLPATAHVVIPVALVAVAVIETVSTWPDSTLLAPLPLGVETCTNVLPGAPHPSGESQLHDGVE